MAVPAPAAAVLTPAEQRALASVRAGLDRLARYDDESVVSEAWVRQRYDRGCFAGYAAARTAAVAAAWHEAGHAVAALAVGARFSSASIHHGRDSGGRVHRIRGAGELAFVIDAAGQIAERLRTWTMLDNDDELRAWLPTWQRDGGDARHFRQALTGTYRGDEIAAWRRSERVLTPRRLAIRQVARALLVHHRPLRCGVVAAVAGDVPLPQRDLPQHDKERR